MTPAVMRDSRIKSHIVLNASIILPIEDDSLEGWGQAVQTLAHECAHVEITKVFNTCFPGTLLKTVVGDFRDALRWQVIGACWDEYAASLLAAPFDRDPTDNYECTFLQTLAVVDAAAEAAIRTYRLHGNHRQIACEVFGAYGSLLKYAAYQLGNLAGSARSLTDLPRTQAALAGHWFAQYYTQLDATLHSLWESYSAWESKAVFERIGDIAESLVASKGLALRSLGDGSVYVEVPFTARTLPLDSATR